MILVDISVLAAYFRGQDTAACVRLDEIAAQGLPFGVSGQTCQELLQAAATEKEYARLREYLGSLPLYGPLYGRASHEDAALIQRRARAAGLPLDGVRALAVQTALEHGLCLLHDDPAFAAIAPLVPELRFWD